MTDEERLFHVIDQTRQMIMKRQQMHEGFAKGSGPSAKRTNGIRARECATILQEMYKIVLEYEYK